MEGMYTSTKRVERGGRLVAFEGEVMTMSEAVSRGLVQAGGQRAPRKRAAKATDESAEEA